MQSLQPGLSVNGRAGFRVYDHRKNEEIHERESILQIRICDLDRQT